MVRDPEPPPAPPEPVVTPPPRGRGRNAAPPPPPPPPPPTPDLVRLLGDDEARVRRRAAQALGRVRLSDGVAPLIEVLAHDDDPEVRQMAGFSLGLIGDTRAVAPLITALDDPSSAVKASAAEALGLLGDVSAVEPITQMATALIGAGALNPLPGDDQMTVRHTPAAAVRLALYALVRLKSYDGVAALTLDSAGRPLRWWPVAFALQRLEDKRALPALLALTEGTDSYTRTFAIKGLASISDPRSAAAVVPLVGDASREIRIEAIRAVARLRASAAAPALLALIRAPATEPTLRLEALGAIGAVGGTGVVDLLIDLLGDRNPLIRAAAIRALAQLDAEGFVTILSGLDLDTDWTVRVALANVLATLSPEAGLPRLRAMLSDPDVRVIPPVLRAIARLKPDDAGAVFLKQLEADDAFVRAAAAEGVGAFKPAGGAEALAAAYDRGAPDSTYLARAAALTALRTYGGDAATTVLRRAAADRDWAVRVRAASLLAALDPGSDAAHAIRPAPAPAIPITDHVVVPRYSTEAFIELRSGTIRVELAVLDAPVTVENFVTLARRGFFDGMRIHRVVPNFVVQAGDPRGDLDGGPGYTIRDEINQRPYLRGTVGMALDWEDTGGSQFFITHSPQPHLDARYTVFGRVLEGMELADRIALGDEIQTIRIWDGQAQ